MAAPPKCPLQCPPQCRTTAPSLDSSLPSKGNRRGWRGWLKSGSYSLLTIFTALLVLACSTSVAPSIDANIDANEPSSADTAADTLTILWDKGYVIEEDEAIQQVVDDWNSQGHSAQLSFYTSSEIAPKTLRASQTGQQPDILFAAKSVYPVTDWKGKLADVTPVVARLAGSYSPEALQAAKVYGAQEAVNGAEKVRYYAVPINQSFTHIYYWKDLLADAGYTPADIPRDWDAFWAFWKTVQTQLAASHPALRSLGLPYSVPALDTYHIFEQVLLAYDVQLLDEQGQLQVDNPQVKAKIVDCLDWYLQFYEQGFVPPDAVAWADTDNNRQMLNRQVVMTPNPTLSIPAALRNDEKAYREQLGIVEFPHKPSGEPMPHLVDIRLAIVFKDSPNQAAARDFLSYLTQPEVLSQFLKASYGRFMPPALNQIEADPFWQNPDDPHVYTSVKTMTEGRSHPFYNVLNPAYGTVMESNVWGQAIYDMAAEGRSAEAAADWAIARIQEIFQTSA